MREILFKAKRVDDREWVVGQYVNTCYPGKDKETGHFIVVYPNEYHEVYTSTLCQFTGLCDKNGKRIWENDIVEAWSQGSRAIGTVKQRVDGLWIMSPAWQNHEFWELKPNSNGETTVEVLVNAFDNPELLQEEHK
jgi:uncharacterized phage protein (TIGR01671 family)